MHIRLKYTFRDDTTCNNLIYKLILTVLAEFLYIQRTEMSLGMMICPIDVTLISIISTIQLYVYLYT